MSKTATEQINLDGDGEQQAAKSQVTSSSPDGPGGRAKVRVLGNNGKPVDRKPRTHDELRPRCPQCTIDDVAVLMHVTSSPGMVTYYGCPSCDHTTSRLKQAVVDRFRHEADQRPANQPFVTRP